VSSSSSRAPRTPPRCAGPACTACPPCIPASTRLTCQAQRPAYGHTITSRHNTVATAAIRSPADGDSSSLYDSPPYDGSSYGSSPYDDALLHTTQSDGVAGVADLADWACSLLLPCDPEAELQMSKGTPGASSYLLPSSFLC
jgi:hypothetical protein